MYKIINIDNLLKDIEDNESRMEMVNIRQEKKTGKAVDTILSGLAALTIFSAAIDADRSGLSPTASTVLATAVALAAVIVDIYFFRKNG